MEKRFRQSQLRSYSKRILIVCEGETEVNYLRGMKNDEERRRKLASVEIDIYQPADYSPKELVAEAVRKMHQARCIERNRYDCVWVVFDKDHHASIPEAFHSARKHRINIAFSIICFEFWILLHYEQRLRMEGECDSILARIRKHYPEYEKSGNHYSHLKDRIDTAIENGKWVIEQTKPELARGRKVYELDAYTNVQELVQFLLTL